jgi:hypothetical protein
MRFHRVSFLFKSVEVSGAILVIENVERLQFNKNNVLHNGNCQHFHRENRRLVFYYGEPICMFPVHNFSLSVLILYCQWMSLHHFDYAYPLLNQSTGWKKARGLSVSLVQGTSTHSNSGMNLSSDCSYLHSISLASWQILAAHRSAYIHLIHLMHR